VSLATFTAAYIECLLWSEIDYDADENGTGNFEGRERDLTKVALKEIDRDCISFYAQYLEICPEALQDDDQAGHDFCLSRNKHGAGFWDGDWGTIGDELHAATKAYGIQGLTAGGDGRLYIHN
jgi:hypothetical protein